MSPVPYPPWLHILAWAYLIICFVCCLWMLLDELKHPQKMWIMDLVWPITGLYLGPAGLWLYYRSLPYSVKPAAQEDHPSGAQKQSQDDSSPDALQTSVAVCHCGTGCTLGDIVGETCVPLFGLFFVGEFGSKLVVDFLLAYALGIGFQYFTIVPMRGLSFGKGVLAAIRADSVSISMFEIGMFGWMALSYFVLFPSPHLGPNEAVFWFMMQIAMMVGFLTAWPANFWLIRKGWKEKMPQYQEEGRQKEGSTQKAA